MTARSAAAVLALLAAAVAISFGASLLPHGASRGSARPVSLRVGAPGTPAFAAARARARAFPFYRSLFARGAVRSAAVLADGAIRLSLDPRAATRSPLSRAGLEGLDDALPPGTTVELRPDATGLSETWRFPCPEGCLLDAFATAGPEVARSAAAAVGGDPSAVAVFRLAPERFRDLALGPRTGRVLRDRVALVEAILGRPVRGPASEDLSGAGSAAFYRDPGGGPARLLVALELVRADRVRGLLDIVLGLGALTRGAAVRRHREVPIGALAGARSGLAAAVDGDLLLLASDPSPIEDAIDRRRDPLLRGDPGGTLPRLGDAGLRLRGDDGLEAALTREGTEWRLEARGPSALADDAVVSAWLRPGGAEPPGTSTGRSGSGGPGP